MIARLFALSVPDRPLWQHLPPHPSRAMSCPWERLTTALEEAVTGGVVSSYCFYWRLGAFRRRRGVESKGICLLFRGTQQQQY